MANLRAERDSVRVLAFNIKGTRADTTKTLARRLIVDETRCDVVLLQETWAEDNVVTRIGLGQHWQRARRGAVQSAQIHRGAVGVASHPPFLHEQPKADLPSLVAARTVCVALSRVDERTSVSPYTLIRRTIGFACMHVRREATPLSLTCRRWCKSVSTC
jgi:hypothetical protein